MARRSDHSRAELMDLAIQAAMRLVAEGGLDRLTVRQIASDIGYSPGTLYNLFENQDDLLVHVAGRTLQRMLDEARALPPEATPEAALHALARFYFRFTRNNQDLWRLVTEHRLAPGRRHPLWYRALMVQVLGQVEAPLHGLFSARDAAARRRCALTLWASMQGICSITRSGSLTAVPDHMALILAQELIEAFLARLQADRAAPAGRTAPSARDAAPGDPSRLPRSPARRSPPRATLP